MESSRIQEECLAMYKVRLESLPKIINELYQAVKNDEVIHNLIGDSMEKYKIGRVNQIVFEVMNSQKQLLLIRALEKCAELNNKIKNMHEQENTANTAKRQNYFDGLIELKQRTDKQIASLNLLIDEKTKTITKLNKENSQLLQKVNQTHLQQTMKLHQPCPNCERISNILAQSKNELQINKQFIQKLKKDGQTAVQALLNKVQVLTQKNCALQAQKQRKSIRKLEVKQSKEQSKHRCEQMKRSQKIEKMKRQMVNVEEQLVQVQRQFNFIRQMVMGTIINDFKKIKNEHLMLKQCVSNYRSRVTTQLHNFVSQMGHKLQIYCLKKNDSILKPERIMSKLNYIENQIDYFLENQVLTE